MTDKFFEFLEEKAASIHDETWDCFPQNLSNPNWVNAKVRENLMGEIIRKYKELHNL